MVLCLNLKELMSICCLVDFGHFMSPLTNYDIQVPWLVQVISVEFRLVLGQFWY